MLHPMWDILKCTWERMTNQSQRKATSVALRPANPAVWEGKALTKAVKLRKCSNAAPAITGALELTEWGCIWRATTSRQHNLKSMKAKKQCFSCHSGLCLLEFLGSWKFPQHTCSYFVQYASSFREQIGKYLFILYKLWKTFTKKITVADDAVYMW